MDIIYFRGAERLFIAFSGLTCIILGFALFRQTYSAVVSSPTEFAAKGGGFELTLRNVWPGVFFAAFGMIILVASVLTQIKTQGTSMAEINTLYQSGGLPPSDTKSRAAVAIAAIGQVLDTENKQPPDIEIQRTKNLSQLKTAQLDLVDVAYGEGSYTKFLELSSRSTDPKGFGTLSEEDRRFFEDLKTALDR
ncbi:MAG TPA: hypothetical protein PK224_03735 [Nitrospira sp.]|nr:hypothetical protein [Nitrospira sp.]